MSSTIVDASSRRWLGGESERFSDPPCVCGIPQAKKNLLQYDISLRFFVGQV
jgi:hypothetical protein